MICFSSVESYAHPRCKGSNSWKPTATTSGALGPRVKNLDTWRVGDNQSTRSCGSPLTPCRFVLYDAIWTSRRSFDRMLGFAIDFRYKHSVKKANVALTCTKERAGVQDRFRALSTIIRHKGHMHWGRSKYCMYVVLQEQTSLSFSWDERIRNTRRRSDKDLRECPCHLHGTCWER